MIKLGGNITLDNFEYVDPSTLVVIKKMVGNYAKKISDKTIYTELIVKLVSSAPSYKLEAVLKNNGKEDKREVDDKNLFFAIDKVLSGYM